MTCQKDAKFRPKLPAISNPVKHAGSVRADINSSSTLQNLRIPSQTPVNPDARKPDTHKVCAQLGASFGYRKDTRSRCDSAIRSSVTSSDKLELSSEKSQEGDHTLSKIKSDGNGDCYKPKAWKEDSTWGETPLLLLETQGNHFDDDTTFDELDRNALQADVSPPLSCDNNCLPIGIVEARISQRQEAYPGSTARA